MPTAVVGALGHDPQARGKGAAGGRLVGHVEVELYLFVSLSSMRRFLRRESSSAPLSSGANSP